MEWTGHAHIRHGSFQGMRPDKDPRKVVREIPV
jgi:ATP-dependent DNA ligase